MPTKARNARKVELEAAKAELLQLFGEPPAWLQALKSSGYRGNLWPLYHPSIRGYVKTVEGARRLVEGAKSGSLRGNETRSETALKAAVALTNKYPYWAERGAAGKIARREAVTRRTIYRYIEILKSVTGA